MRRDCYLISCERHWHLRLLSPTYMLGLLLDGHLLLLIYYSLAVSVDCNPAEELPICELDKWEAKETINCTS